jgi:hypothetical protein
MLLSYLICEHDRVISHLLQTYFTIKQSLRLFGDPMNCDKIEELWNWKYTLISQVLWLLSLCSVKDIFFLFEKTQESGKKAHFLIKKVISASTKRKKKDKRVANYLLFQSNIQFQRSLGTERVGKVSSLFLSISIQFSYS